MSSASVRIGTRGSPLALAQTEQVRARLASAWPILNQPGAIEIKVIRTTGDRILDRPLSEVGGKGLFTKEIDDAMLSRDIDLAVHSMKDLPTWLPDGIVVGATLAREDPRDVLIAPSATSIDALPAAAIVGTSSLRRQAQLLHHRPDLAVVALRGNVHTRLGKVVDGTVGATMLALAGLHRLGIDLGTSQSAIFTVIDTDVILPAVGQGAICVTCREGDARCRSLLSVISDNSTASETIAERGMLEVLDGSCRTPIAGLARILADGRLVLRGIVAKPDGSTVHAAERTGIPADAQALGRDVGDELKRRAGADFFAGVG